MLYMQAGPKKIIVLESANLEELKKGRPATTPDASVLIAWTADPVWLADKIIDTNGDAAAIGKLIIEAAKRPEKPSNRPYHKPHVEQFVKHEFPDAPTDPSQRLAKLAKETAITILGESKDEGLRRWAQTLFDEAEAFLAAEK